VGTVNSPTHGEAFGPLLKRAGLALGEAKRVASQALPVMPFRMDLELAAKHRLVLEQELRQCLDGSQFSLLLQPKVCLNTGAVVGAEALIRWMHPKRGILAPGAFLPMAREIGAMRAIDAWVLRQAIGLCAQLRDFGATFPLSINLSADALGDVMLPERLHRDLATARLPASMLEIEIPEGDLMADVQASVRTLEALANMGVRLSIDDFGTGYSSFAYLAQFPVHTLKIDRSFVIGLSGSGPSRKIVKGIVRLAHSLGLDVVAEGAEDEHQLVQLQRLKCDAVQGFAVAPAMQLPQFRAFAASRPAVAGPDPFAI
jgi:EAL domain-containing protein (putative c-di-GMP-specific phosphodiesterase class I)